MRPLARHRNITTGIVIVNEACDTQTRSRTDNTDIAVLERIAATEFFHRGRIGTQNAQRNGMEIIDQFKPPEAE